MSALDEDPISTPRRTITVARSRGLGWISMAGVWAIVFVFVWTLVRSDQTAPLHNPNAKPHEITPRGDLLTEEQATIKIFRDASPSVVYITTIEYRRDFFSLNVFQIPKGTGSGFVWDREGHIVTNAHLLVNANAIVVTLADGTSVEAELVGYEKDKDLAVLKIDLPSDKLKPLPIGTSANLMVGQKVLAIGNPFGFDRTLTTGVVSALGREITSLSRRPIRDVIQTDAAINPGNSGGPLLDSSGRLIGVNTQIASPSGTSVGVGFAVPVDIVNRVVPQIIAHGRVIRPVLGVRPAPDRIARQWQLPGVLLLEVYEGGGAAKAGLRGTIARRDGQVRQLGDVILRIDDQQVRTQYDLLDILERHKVGDAVRVRYLRNGKEADASIVLRSPS